MVSYSRVFFFSYFENDLHGRSAAFNSTRGIPGKWFALPFGIVLLFAVWLVVSMAFRFQAIMKQLEATREVWPKAANVIRDHLNDSLSPMQHPVRSLHRGTIV